MSFGRMNMYSGGPSQSSISTPYTPPITTGVPLSERFKGLQQSQRPVLTKGGYGYGVGPSSMTPSFFPQPQSQFSQQEHYGGGSSSNDYSARNKALAAALSRRTQALMLRSRLMGRNKIIGGGMRGVPRAPVASRIGVNPLRYNNKNISLARAGGGIVKNRRGINRGQGNMQFVKKNVPTLALGRRGRGITVARGGGGRGRGGPQFNRSNRGGASVAGRGGGATKWFGVDRSKDDLDKELDAYMSKSKTKVKSDLDKDLDEYMKEARAQALLSLGGITSAENGEGGDVAMKDVSAASA